MTTGKKIRDQSEMVKWYRSKIKSIPENICGSYLIIHFRYQCKFNITKSGYHNTFMTVHIT